MSFGPYRAPETYLKWAPTWEVAVKPLALLWGNAYSWALVKPAHLVAKDELQILTTNDASAPSQKVL